jgi:excisionase family DNA binding protein
MQFEDNRVYRVKDVAEALDVSVATIYRAIESGKLDALKIGEGKGTLRIPGWCANVYVNTCHEAAYDSFVVKGEPVTDDTATHETAGEVA